MAPPVQPLIPRFMAKVAKDETTGCWDWTGGKLPQGYGNFWMGGTTRRAHRVAYELFVGPIPPGLVLDHLCRNRGCVNPEHLEPVTARENVIRGDLPELRKTHCPQGHPYEGSNLRIVAATGHRKCRICANAAKRKHYHLSGRYQGNPPAAERTHCPQGHEYTPENTYVPPVGGRVCKTCKLESHRVWAEENRERYNAIRRRRHAARRS